MLGKRSGWSIDSIIDHTISISKYHPSAGKSYIKLSKEFDQPRKRLINIQNIDDNECFKWYLIRYLNPADHNSWKITKADRDFPKSFDFKDINFPVKIREIYKIENKNSIGITVFGYKYKEKISNLCIKKLLWRKTCWLINDRRRREKHYLMNDFNTFMCDYSLHRGRKLLVVIVYMHSFQEEY